jgi:hypothetical protein
VKGCGEKIYNARVAFGEPAFGGINLVAGKVGVGVDAEAVREDNVLEAAGALNALVLLVFSYGSNKRAKSLIWQIGGFEDDYTGHGERREGSYLLLLAYFFLNSKAKKTLASSSE